MIAPLINEDLFVCIPEHLSHLAFFIRSTKPLPLNQSTQMHQKFSFYLLLIKRSNGEVISQIS